MSNQMRNRFRYFTHFLRDHPFMILGLVIVLINLVFLVAAPLIAPWPPETAYPEVARQPPSLQHPFGTDDSGMDVFSRVIHAPRTDFLIAVTSTAIALIVGVIFGSISGYFGGKVGTIIMRGADLIQAFPVFILAMVLVSMMGQRISNVIYAIAIIVMPQFLRLVRVQALGVKSLPYIEAAKSAGASESSVLFKHVIPNSIGPAVVHASVIIGFSMLLTAGISFVGAGVRTPTPEWGLMISIGASNVITGEWWTALFPGLALGIAVLGFALVGDGLRELLDPVKRR